MLKIFTQLKYILCDIKKSNKLKEFNDESINHSGETNFESLFEWLLFRRIKPNDRSIKQLTNDSIGYTSTHHKWGVHDLLKCSLSGSSMPKTPEYQPINKRVA
jgi:hypothetical protein